MAKRTTQSFWNFIGPGSISECAGNSTILWSFYYHFAVLFSFRFILYKKKRGEPKGGGGGGSFKTFIYFYLFSHTLKKAKHEDNSIDGQINRDLWEEIRAGEPEVVFFIFNIYFLIFIFIFYFLWIACDSAYCGDGV